MLWEISFTLKNGQCEENTSVLKAASRLYAHTNTNNWATPRKQIPTELTQLRLD
jgi:hypothetical protein